MDDKTSEQLIELAQQQIQQHQFDKAIDALKNALRTDPENHQTYVLLAICHHDLYRESHKKQYLKPAKQYAEQALQLEPGDDVCHYILGLVLFAENKKKLAKQHFLEALKIDPNDSDYYQILGVTSRGKEALNYYQKALELDPENVDCLTTLSNHYYFKKADIKTAKQYAATALRIDPMDIDGLVIMGHILNHQGKHQEAREHALLAFKQNPKYQNTLILICVVESRKNIFIRTLLKLQLWTNKPTNYVMYLIAWISLCVICHYLGLRWFSLVFVVYLYGSNYLFKRKLEKYLATQELNPNY